MPETVNGDKTKSLAASTHDRMLVLSKIIIPAVFVLVVSVGLTTGLYRYLVEPGPETASTMENMPSTTPEPLTSITPENLTSETPSETPSTTQSIASSSTPSTTPLTTLSTTPSVTTSTTPPVSTSTTPSITTSTTPSITTSTTPSTTTSTTLSTTPSPTHSIMFVASFDSVGVIAFNLQTLKVTTITKEHAFAVAVNHKLKKVYWSEYDARIMRSNFDGSAIEIIIPPPDNPQVVLTIAIDGPSGNVYFSKGSSVMTCSSLGENCAVILSDTSLFQYPYSIVLDSENGLMYLTARDPGREFISANMDGSNARIIDGGFEFLYGIALEINSNHLLYWTDLREGTVGTVDVSGRNKRILMQLQTGIQPTDIRVDAHKIYLTALQSNAILSADKFTGGDLQTILSISGTVSDLALFSAPV